jgi:hypothetical protein
MPAEAPADAPADAPTVDLGERFSDPGVGPRPWEEARGRIDAAELYWITTVRPDGRPHVTPLVGAWHDEALWFCTGADERKARNLEANPSCVLTTGCNTWKEGFDVVIEGEAVQVTDDARLQQVADAYLAKYGGDWTFTVGDGRFHHEGGSAPVFEVRPHTVFGFAKGPFSQTRYRFGDADS